MLGRSRDKLAAGSARGHRACARATAGLLLLRLMAWRIARKAGLAAQHDAPWEARTPDLEVNSLTL